MWFVYKLCANEEMKLVSRKFNLCVHISTQSKLLHAKYAEKSQDYNNVYKKSRQIYESNKILKIKLSGGWQVGKNFTCQ